MEFEPQDRKVVELLTKLKGANESYPSDMLAARRQAFLNNMAGAGLSVGTGSSLNQPLKGGGGSGAAPVTVGKLLEVALLVAIVAEASALAYFYRDKVTDVFRSILAPSQVQEIVSPPVITSPFPDFEISEIPSSAIPTATASEMATSTQVPGVADDPTSNNNVAVTLTGSTPDPNVNNGNHYGQTPKPERTKDNKDNQPPKDNPGNGNNDKPPKEK
jgi:hypothetical protein